MIRQVSKPGFVILVVKAAKPGGSVYVYVPCCDLIETKEPVLKLLKGKTWS